MTTLYRCKAPTDLVCRCGKVARRMRAMEMDFDEVRVPFLKRDRPEVEELSGQRWVPVLVHGDDVIHDSHRILEYLEWLEHKNSRPRPARARGAVRGARRAWPYVLMAWERWQSLSPEDKERYKKQARGYAERGREDAGRAAPPASAGALAPVSGGLYFFALVAALALCVIGGLLAHRPKRSCPRCGRQIPMSVRRCRHCQYEIE